MSLSSWHEKGRPALFEALAAVCDKIDEDIEAEFKEKTSKCQHSLKPGELETLRARAADAARLEQDNRRLREALSKLEKDRSKRTSPPQASNVTVAPTQTATASGSVAGESPAPARDENIAKKLQLLEESYRILKTNFNTAKVSLNKRKIERDQWIAYSKELEKKIQNLKAKSKSKTAVTTPKDSGKIVDNEPIAIPSTSFISESDGANIEDVFDSRPVTSTEPPPPSIDEERICDSQPPHDLVIQPTASNATSQDLPVLPPPDELQRPVSVKPEPVSDDSIAIVDERQIRKRPLEDPEGQESRAVTRIKEEHLVDTPIVDAPGFSPQDSMDLSNAGPKFQTPRRPRVQEDVGCSLNVEVFSSQASVIPDSPTHAGGDTGQGPSVWSQNGTTEVQQTAMDPPSRPAAKRSALSSMWDRDAGQRQVASRAGVAREPGDRIVEGAQETQSDDGSSIQPSNDENRPPSYDLNQQPANPTVNGPSEQRRHSLDQVHSLTDLDVPQPRQLPFDNVTKTSRRDFNRTFHEEPSVAASKPAPERIRSPNTSFSGFPRENNNGKAATRPTGVLRKKRLNELGLDDFKINPKFNNGYSYAYSEVVRGRAERAALPGCTDPTCCGQDFNVLARAARGNLVRTAEQRHEDKIYLERYLGDEAFRLFGMTREEIDNMWIEAKAKELADRWGKHRHRFARMKSPPGFWNADFPTTQEVQAERDEAEKRRGEEVEVRYREAMRPDGRWMFRDE